MLGFAGYWQLPEMMSGVLWHQHEMAFGFVAAAVCGFSMTALPSWCKKPRLFGGKLFALWGLWIIGRIAFLIPDVLGPELLAAVDLLFVTALAMIATYYIVAGRNWTNSPVLLMLGAFAAGNWLFHLEILGISETAEFGFQLSIFAVVMLISIIGGKVTPAFTRNWLNKHDIKVDIAEPMQLFDKVALVSLVVFMVFQLFLPDETITIALAALAAVLHFYRMLRWKFWTVRSEPIMWVLHLGYFWIIIGLLLVVCMGFDGGVPASSAMHAFTAGAFGTFILAMMTRATLGHSGREIKASILTSLIFVLISVSAVLRLIAPLLGENSDQVLLESAVAWVLAFGLFVVEYLPILTRKRIEVQP